jgi:hypothetical protein
VRGAVRHVLLRGEPVGDARRGQFIARSQPTV